MPIASTPGIDTDMHPQLGGNAFPARERLVLPAGGLAEVSRVAVTLGLGLCEYIPQMGFQDTGSSPVVFWRSAEGNLQLAFCDDFYRDVRLVDIAGTSVGHVNEWAKRLRGELALTDLGEVLERARGAERTSDDKIRDIRELACLAVVWNLEVASAFARHLADDDAEVRFHAALVASYVSAQPEITAAFRRMAESDPDPVVRACAASLRDGKFEYSDPPIAAWLAVEPGVSRRRIMAIAWAARLRFAGRRREAPAFTWASLDGRVELTYFDDPGRTPHLMLSGAADDVRPLAEQLAGEPGLLDAPAVLAALAAEERPEVLRTRVAQASWMLRAGDGVLDPAWRGPIERCAAHPDAAVRAAVVQALAVTGGAGADILERLAGDPEVRVRALARKLLRVFAVTGPSPHSLAGELECAAVEPDGEDDGLVRAVVPRHVKLSAGWPFAHKGWCFRRCRTPGLVGGFIMTFDALDGGTTLHVSRDPRADVALVAVEGQEAQAILDAYLTEARGCTVQQRESEFAQIDRARWGEDDVLRRAAELGILNPARWGDLYPRVAFPTAAALRDELATAGPSTGTAADLAAACDAALRGEIVRALERVSAVLTAADAARFPQAKPLAREILRGSARPLTAQKAWLPGVAAKRALHAAEDSPERIGAIRREISWML